MKKWYQREYIWHILFWLIYLMLRLWVIRIYEGPFLFRLSVELLEIPIKALALYLTIYVVVERLLLRKQYVFMIAYFVVLLLAIMWLNRVEDYFIIYPLTHIGYVRYEFGFWSWKAAFVNLIYIYPVVGLGTTLYFVRSWFENTIARERLAREKLEMELKSLRDQIHPHFLFNTLNNIYSLALSESPRAADMMLRLSKLLSYMIYDTNSPSVPLLKEVQALKDYVALEQLRLGERLECSFEVSGRWEQVLIAPLLLFPLLENCFKHGSHQTSEFIWIRVNILVKDSMLEVQFENSLPADVTKSPTSAGIGQANVRKRLELLYPGHALRIHHADTYLVNMKLPLA